MASIFLRLFLHLRSFHHHKFLPSVVELATLGILPVGVAAAQRTV